MLQTFSTNQTAANKQGIHGLLESGLPCTLNMVLHVNTMCVFGMERKYPTIPYLLSNDFTLNNYNGIKLYAFVCEICRQAKG